MKLAIVTALILATRVAHAEAPAEELPPVTIGQLTGGLALGGSLAILSGAAMVKVTEHIECTIDREKGYDAFEGPCFRRDLYAITLGASIGLGLGFYAVGKIANGNHSLLTSVGGAILGTLGGALISELVVRDGGPSDVRNAGAGLFITLTGPIVGAIAGYHFGRRSPKRASSQPGLVRYDGGTVSLGVPAISYTDHAPVLSLAGGSF